MDDYFEPRITVLYCRQSVEKDADIASAGRAANGFRVREVVMPCSCKVEIPHILKIIEQGEDGVLVVACSEKECRFLDGSTRAGRRIDYAQSLLEQVGMGSGRLSLIRGNGLLADDVMRAAADLAEATRSLGMNPLRGESSR